MVKHIHASVREYTFDKVTRSNPYKGFSEWIEELLLRGLEAKEKENNGGIAYPVLYNPPLENLLEAT